MARPFKELRSAMSPERQEKAAKRVREFILNLEVQAAAEAKRKRRAERDLKNAEAQRASKRD